MAVMVMVELPGVTTEQYERINETMGVSSAADVPGLLSHTAGTTDEGLLVADVWESPEAFERFVEERLVPALQQVGVSARPEPRIVPVRNHIPRGAGTHPGVLMVIEADGFEPGTYDTLVSRMDAHVGDGSGHPAVSHVAGVTDSGMVFVDVWGSPDEFAGFAESQIGPAAEGTDMPELEPRFMPIHNHMRA